MARIHIRYGHLAAGVAALSLLAACSGGGFKGAARRLVQPAGGAFGRRRRLPDRRGALPAGLRGQPQLHRGAGRPRPQLRRHGPVRPRRAGAERGEPAQAQGSRRAARARPHPARRRRRRRRRSPTSTSPSPSGRATCSLITARGIALDRLSRHAEAQATYREGLKRDPTDFALNSNLGLSLGLSGQTDAGITHPARAGARRRGQRQHPRQPRAGLRPCRPRERGPATLAGDLSGERDPEQPRLLPRAARPARSRASRSATSASRCRARRPAPRPRRRRRRRDRRPARARSTRWPPSRRSSPRPWRCRRGRRQAGDARADRRRCRSPRSDGDRGQARPAAGPERRGARAAPGLRSGLGAISSGIVRKRRPGNFARRAGGNARRRCRPHRYGEASRLSRV